MNEISVHILQAVVPDISGPKFRATEESRVSRLRCNIFQMQQIIAQSVQCESQCRDDQKIYPFNNNCDIYFHQQNFERTTILSVMLKITLICNMLSTFLKYGMM